MGVVELLSASFRFLELLMRRLHVVIAGILGWYFKV